MSTTSLRVVARIKARDGMVSRVKDVLLSLLEPTRRETGCLVYELLQNEDDPTDFTFVEEWTTDQALDAHLASPHVEKAFALAGDLLAAPPDVRRYRLAG